MSWLFSLFLPPHLWTSTRIIITDRIVSLLIQILGRKNGLFPFCFIPWFSKLLSEIIKQEQSEDHSQRETYSVTKTKLSTNPEKSDHIQPQTSGESMLKKHNEENGCSFRIEGIIPIHRNPRETINNLSGISMTNIGGQLISNSNASHLPNGNGSYFLPGISINFTTKK